MSKLYYVAVPVVKLWFSSVSRLHVVGQENVPKNGPLIVAANHLSLVDPPLIGGFFPRRIVFMAKDELFSFPSGLLIRALGAFPARKTKVSVEALRRALGVLDDGQPIWKTRAEMQIPVGRKKYTFAYGLNRCRQQGQFNSRLIGLIDWTQNKEYPRAIKVWLVDLEREQFREINATDVECENVSYGV